MDESEALNQWQIEETKKALAEADRGDFASAEEVRQTFDRWKRRED
jgi:predicted transcriptional regulator